MTIEIEDNENSDNEDNKDNKNRDKEEGPYSRGNGVSKKCLNNASEAKDNSLSIEGRAALADLNN